MGSWSYQALGMTLLVSVHQPHGTGVERAASALALSSLNIISYR